MNTFNTVRTTKTLSLAAAMLLLATPFTSQAHDYDAAMDACIKAFVSSNVPKGHPVTVRKEDVAASPITIPARAYTIELSAKLAESGKYLARGSCFVDRSGAVTALNGKPLPQQLAAR